MTAVPTLDHLLMRALLSHCLRVMVFIHSMKTDVTVHPGSSLEPADDVIFCLLTCETLSTTIRCSTIMSESRPGDD
jgi:hypothetical protein